MKLPLDSSCHIVDKASLIGTSILLPLAVDAESLVAEFHRIPSTNWGSRGGRVGVHMQTEAIFLRGFAPAEGELPIEDRSLLETLPAFRSTIYQLLDAQPLRCLLAKLQPMGSIPLHIDKGGYFEKTIRIHIPIVTNQQSVMMVDGEEVHMRVGEVWAINNCAMHGVENRNTSEARTHLICDYLPSEKLVQLLVSTKSKQR